MFNYLLVMLPTVVLGQDGGRHGDDPLDWLRDSIPGEPGVDYPIFAMIPDTEFDCSDRVHGGKFISDKLTNFLKKEEGAF